MDIHTRKLRSFVVLADELHFSRAAARLIMAQQALSKQIRELEDLVGAQLFQRTSRKVELTAAGEAFLVATRTVLGTLDGGVESARHAGSGRSGVLRLGFPIGAALELTPPILAEFTRRFPAVEIRQLEASLADPSAGLLDGTTDVAFIRLPCAVRDLDYAELFVEPLVVALAARHPLADRDRVDVGELLGETVAIADTTDAVFEAFFTLEAHRDGRERAKVVRTRSHTEEMGVIAAGGACSITVAAAARFTPYPGVRFVPIDGVRGSTVAVAWRRGPVPPVVEQFREVVAEVRARETAVLAWIENPFAGRQPGAAAPARGPAPQVPQPS